MEEYIPQTTFKNLNDISETNIDIEIKSKDDIPYPVYDVLILPFLSMEGKYHFLRKFGINYMLNPYYKDYIKNAFIFLFDKDFEGLFHSEDEIVQEAKRRNIKGKNIFIVSITPHFLQEISERVIY